MAEAPRYQDSRHMKVVRLSALHIGRFYPPPPRNIPGTYFFRGWVNPRVIVRPEGLTPSGIEHATFRFVAQCRNQLPHRVPKRLLSKKYISRNIPSDYRLTL